MVQAPVPIEIAGGEFGGEAVVFGGFAEAVGVVKDGRAAGDGSYTNGKGIVEEGRAFVFGPDFVGAIGGDDDFGGDFGGGVGLVGHGVAQAAGPDAAEDHVLVEIVTPAADLPAGGGAKAVLGDPLHIFALEDDTGRVRWGRGGGGGAQW